MPAAVTMPSTLPRAFTTFSNAALRLSSLLTSHWMYSVFMPYAFGRIQDSHLCNVLRNGIADSHRTTRHLSSSFSKIDALVEVKSTHNIILSFQALQTLANALT
nr:hypothetical protein CFP56_37235 [Quercus suber]